MYFFLVAKFFYCYCSCQELHFHTSSIATNKSVNPNATGTFFSVGIRCCFGDMRKISYNFASIVNLLIMVYSVTETIFFVPSCKIYIDSTMRLWFLLLPPSRGTVK